MWVSLMSFDFNEIETCIKTGQYKFIAKGSGRKVYDMDDGYVVKQAFNKKGFAQNQTEYYLSSIDTENIFAKTFAISTDHKYIIMKRANKLKSIRPVCNYFGVKNSNQLHNNEIISNMVKKYHLNIADIKNFTSWGLIDDTPLIIDYGLTDKIYTEYYLKERIIILIAVFLFILK